MGFLELGNIKIKTLELFLTDKGKELMLEQNGLGLHDLIRRFTLYDEDFDYRTTSLYWEDGLSPQPQNPNPPGSDQGLVNDFRLNPNTSSNPKADAPTSGTSAYFDITDVRGHRNRFIQNCFNFTAYTSGITECTNIYCFYDCTSVSEAIAIDAKAGIDTWTTGYRAANPDWFGKVFHVTLYGERWINSSYYPWHGELDTVSYSVSSSPNSPSTSMVNAATNSVYYPPGGGTSQIVASNPTGELYGVTGNFCGTESNNAYDASFQVLPPGTYLDDSGSPGSTASRGSKLVYYVTGCSHTQQTNTNHQGNLNKEIGPVNTSTHDLPYTATTTGTIWGIQPGGSLSPSFTHNSFVSFDPSQIDGDCAALDYWFTANLGMALFDDLCADNCCSDDYVETGSIFSCGCQVYDNVIQRSTGTTIQSTYGGLYPGFAYGICKHVNAGAGITAPGGVFSGSPIGQVAVTGSTVFNKSNYHYPCEIFKGGDRNVMIINMTDESAACKGNSWGGIFPLGEKKYYGKGSVSLGAPSVSTISQWGTYTGERGYHGGQGQAGGSTDDIDATFFGTASVKQAEAMGWNADGTQSLGPNGCHDLSGLMPDPQPTPDFQYGQDLFMRTLPFYDNFIGFAYPVVKDQNAWLFHYVQHVYGAVIGGTLDLSAGAPYEIPVNKTISQFTTSYQQGFGALSGANPYCELIPVIYHKPDPAIDGPYGPTKTPAWGNDGSGGCAGQMVPTTSCIESHTSTWAADYPSGLINYGWGINPTVGCLGGVPCSSSAIFTSQDFQNDLSAFISGGTRSIVELSGCTYCQCLPAVFINRIGPPDPVIVDSGCLCPDGTYSPACCPDVPDIVESLCGPHPTSSSTLRSVRTITPTNQSPTLDNSVDSNQVLRNYGGEGNWGNAQMMGGMDLSTVSLSKQRRGLSVDIKAQIQPFGYERNGETLLDYDVLLTNESYMDDYKLTKGDASYYWIIESGLEELRPGYIPRLKKCNQIDASEVRIKALGGGNEDFIYLNTIRTLNEGHYWKHQQTEYCITLAVEIQGKMLINTKRIRIMGNPHSGWHIKSLTS